METAFLLVGLRWKAVVDPAGPLLRGGLVPCASSTPPFRSGDSFGFALDVLEVPSCWALLCPARALLRGIEETLLFTSSSLLFLQELRQGKRWWGLLLLLLASFHLNWVFFQNRESAVAQSVVLSNLPDTHFFQQKTDWHLFHGLVVQTFVSACIVQISPFSK